MPTKTRSSGHRTSSVHPRRTLSVERYTGPADAKIGIGRPAWAVSVQPAAARRYVSAVKQRLIQLIRSLRRRLSTIGAPRLISAQRLDERAFLRKFDPGRIAGWSAGRFIWTRRGLGSWPVTREALLAHYGRRLQSDALPGSAAWPRPPESIRDPRIQIAELNEQELIELADNILEHRFVLSEHAPLTTEAGKLDWQRSPTPNIEWLWALNRHQWWCIWGLAYERTRDERYAAAFVDQMLEWVATHPPPARKNEQSPSWRLMEVGVRMRVSWIPCFALFYNSAAFTDDAKMIMLRAIYDHARFLYLFQTTNNHFIQESNGLAYLSATFTEFREAQRWLEQSLVRLDQALTEQVNPDGSHFELSTGYQSLVLSEYQSASDLIQANGLKLPRHDLTGWLARMYRMIAFLSHPDGSLPMINDGFLYWKIPYLAQAGRALDCEDLVFVGTGGRQGAPPAQTSVSLSDAGLYIMRSDWGPNAHYLLFDGGPYGGYHGHEDKLSIQVCAFGQNFISDPGCHNYDQADPLRAYFVSSCAHSTVLVDGKSQIRRWYREHLQPQVTSHDARHCCKHRAHVVRPIMSASVTSTASAASAALPAPDKAPKAAKTAGVTRSVKNIAGTHGSASTLSTRAANADHGCADVGRPGEAIWVSDSQFDYASATYGDGYAEFSFKKPRALNLSSPSSRADVIRDVAHTRQVLFVKGQQSGGAHSMPDYWLIVDTLEASEPHGYQILFHTAPGISVTALDGARDQTDACPPNQSTGVLLSTHPGSDSDLGSDVGARSSRPLGSDSGLGTDGHLSASAQLYLIPAGPIPDALPGTLQVSWRTGSMDPIQGWYSAEFGQKVPVNTITFDWTPRPQVDRGRRTQSTVLTTLVYPCWVDPKRPWVDRAVPTIQPLALPVDDRLAFTVTWAEGTDYLMVPSGKQISTSKVDGAFGEVRLGPYRCSSAIAAVRTDGSDQIITRFEWGGNV